MRTTKATKATKATKETKTTKTTILTERGFTARSAFTGAILFVMAMMCFQSFSFACLRHPFNLQLPEGENVSYMFHSEGVYLNVYIRKDGMVRVGGQTLQEPAQLKRLIEDEIDSMTNPPKGFRLYADGKVKFGKVVSVMADLKEAGLKKGFLVTHRYASLLYYLARMNHQANQKEKRIK